MFLRLTHLYFLPETANEGKEIYMKEIAPIIREQKGNKEAVLLESQDASHELISSSLWEEEENIRDFEASASYEKIISRVKEIVSKPPVQKYYHVFS